MTSPHPSSTKQEHIRLSTTGRDYCYYCNEIVGYWELMCRECEKSSCDDCVYTYDSLSRVVALKTRFIQKLEPTITTNEFIQLKIDLQSDQLKNCLLQNINRDNFSYINNELKMAINAIINMDDSENIQEINSILRCFLRDMLMCIDICFICYNCIDELLN
jgi:hypothetical protein